MVARIHHESADVEIRQAIVDVPPGFSAIEWT